MLQRDQTAEDFVDAVHRRLIISRGFEHIGRGFLIGSLLGMLLVAIAIWQGLPTGPILLFCGILGLLIGCGLVIYRWPSRLNAATEADRQLALNDLLTTALSSRTIANGDFTAAVIAMADACCRAHSPSDVLLRQLGIRSWSAIGLAMSIVVTLAVIPFGSSRSQAKDANLSVLSSNFDQAIQKSVQSHPSFTVTNDPMSESASNSSMSTEQPDGHHADAASQHGTNVPGTVNTFGSGDGSSTSANSGQPKMQSSESTSHLQNSTGTVAGGGNGDAQAGGHGEAASGTRVAIKGGTAETSMEDGTAASLGHASRLLNDQHVPAEDRELVREFFDQK